MIKRNEAPGIYLLKLKIENKDSQTIKLIIQ